MTKLQRDNDAPGKVHHTAGGLPETCYSVLLSDPTQIITLRRGVIGYIPNMQREDAAAIVANLNEGITPAQVEAMKAGSMFGWDVPGADPANYDEQGRPRRDVPDATKAPQQTQTVAIPRELFERIKAAISAAESFMSGFEDDDTQEEPIDDDLEAIRQVESDLDAID